MFINKIKSEGLSHNAYFIGSENEAIVVDPRRDCKIFIDIAQQEEITIKGIFETHRNEDYVIGSIELAKRTGAEIYHGSKLDFKYGQYVEGCNAVVLAGPMFDREFQSNFEVLLKRANSSGVKIILMSTGGIDYSDQEVEHCRKILKKYRRMH